MIFSRRRVVTSALMLFLGGIALYGTFEARRFLQGPVLAVAEPRPGALLVGGSATVTGIARNISFIELNGRQIYTDESGMFRELLTPAPGYTMIAVEVRDRFGRSARVELPVMIK